MNNNAVRKIREDIRNGKRCITCGIILNKYDRQIECKHCYDRSQYKSFSFDGLCLHCGKPHKLNDKDYCIKCYKELKEWLEN